MDIVGLYLSPPNRALVLSIDEKSQIQGLDREQPVLPMMPGIPERRTHSYVRHGTTSLFAALDLASGFVIGKCYRRHRAAEFLNFLKEIDAQVPDVLDVHMSCTTMPLTRRQRSRRGSPPAALSRVLPADLRIMDQSGRALVCQAHQKAAPARRPHFCQVNLKLIFSLSSIGTIKIPGHSNGPSPPTES
jgi:hypothetical protein